jgi:hypothetical protein
MNERMNSQLRVGKDIKEGVFDLAMFQILTVVPLYIHFLSAQDVKLPILA